MAARRWLVVILLLAPAGAARGQSGGVFEVVAPPGDGTAALRAAVTDHRHVRIPAGVTLTLSGGVAMPADTTLEGPGTIRLSTRSAGLSPAERCTLRDLRFVCDAAFAHGSAIRVASDEPGKPRPMDLRIVGCRFEAMRGHALEASDVTHIRFSDNYWANHSDSKLFYNATLLRGVGYSRFDGNTLLHPNQGLLFRGGWHNRITNNYVENCLQGISCYTTGDHAGHWQGTLFAHNVIANNQIARLREEGICYDNSMGRTPAGDAAQNPTRAVAALAGVAADDNCLRVTLADAANPGHPYADGWADHYYVGLLTGKAAGMLLEVVGSGVADGRAWIDLPRTSVELPDRLAAGDRIWIAAGCFYNVISDNVVDNAGMVSGGGNATCIGLWGAAWHNRITGNVCTTRQYGITIGCVGLDAPDSPQGPCAGNDISGNSIAATWPSRATRVEPDHVGGIAFVYIGDGKLLAGRLFQANRITHNTLSWAGRRPIALARDFGSYVAFNRITDSGAAIWMDHTSGAVLESNRTAAGDLVTATRREGDCTFRLVGADAPRP
ncbi:MAG: hypothetical protein BIFFINMI_00906 [Phycisphaerae bacterium]|nr:hypothetical protein [Phycisphaerae bacterium]